jgi:Luciferase-like monooxygenase
MREARAAGDRAAANAAIPDEVVDDLIVHGSFERCRERVAEYVESGVDTPVISVLPTGADPLQLVRSLAPYPGSR